MPPLPRVTGEGLARRIRAVWRRSRIFAGKPRNWRGVRRFRSIDDASTAGERMRVQHARVLSVEELALIDALLPADAEWRAPVMESVKRGRIFDDPWKHGTIHVHIDAPLIPTPPIFYTRRGVDRLGAPVDLSLWLVENRSFSLHCFRLDNKPFAGYPALDTLGQLKIS